MIYSRQNLIQKKLWGLSLAEHRTAETKQKEEICCVHIICILTLNNRRVYIVAHKQAVQGFPRRRLNVTPKPIEL